MQTVDLSVGKSFSMGSNTAGKFFGGMRFAKYSERDNGGGSAESDLTFNTIDLNLGLKYKRQLTNGGNWHAGLGLTSKLWNGVSDNDSENISAYGLKLSFGMNF